MPVQFSVNIVKGEAIMVLECESNGEYIIIKHLSLDDDNEGDEGLASFPAYRWGWHHLRGIAVAVGCVAGTVCC